MYIYMTNVHIHEIHVMQRVFSMKNYQISYSVANLKRIPTQNTVVI